MSPTNIKDLLTSFSPSLDYFAIGYADGRIKIWGTTKGQLQTEFSDIASPPNGMGMHEERQSGHLSFDNKCMKWVQLQSKKKRKPRSSLLVLGTGSGDVMAIDVAAGQLRWKTCDLHPGGTTAVSYSSHDSCIYTAGVDGIVCKIDTSKGSVVTKFRASAKAITSMSISADGKILATGAGRLKVFNCLDYKKIQKFSGHSVTVRCMMFSENGKYLLSSAVGERYVAIWKIDGGRKQYATCFLSMEHPAVFLDSMAVNNGGTEGAGLYVVAVSEMGLCYFWYGSTIDELRDSKPTKISLSKQSSLSKSKTGFSILAAKFRGIVKPGFGSMLVAYGSLIKPSFQEIVVQYGIDTNLSVSQDGILLPAGQMQISHRGQADQTKVTALDRANAEDAILHPKFIEHDKKRKRSVQNSVADSVNPMADPGIKDESWPSDLEDPKEMEEDGITCLEDRLRAAGILCDKDGSSIDSCPGSPTKISLNATVYNDSLPTKKVRAQVLSMSPGEAYKLLETLVSTWKMRSLSSRHILSWIYCILINHGHFIRAQDSSAQILDSLQKMTRLKCEAKQSLLMLSGRHQLIMRQIDRTGQNVFQAPLAEHQDGGSDAESEDVDEIVYGKEEDGYGSDTDDDETQP